MDNFVICPLFCVQCAHQGGDPRANEFAEHADYRIDRLNEILEIIKLDIEG